MPSPRSTSAAAEAARRRRPTGKRASLNRSKAPSALLQAPGWRPEARTALSRLIRRGSGKQLPVALDFDNTIVCGDVHEATLAVLLR